MRQAAAVPPPMMAMLCMGCFRVAERFSSLSTIGGFWSVWGQYLVWGARGVLGARVLRFVIFFVRLAVFEGCWIRCAA